MNVDAFLTCLGFFGLSTGASDSLEGLYAFNSGTTGIIYNQLYPTGTHFSNGQIYAPAIPLVNATNRTLSNNTFTGHCFHVGYQHTGNFSLILEIEHSGCIKRNLTPGKDVVLLSTVVNHSGLGSGFIVGINDSNRLFFKTLNLQYTVETELGIHDFVYVGLAQNQYVNFGLFSVNDDTVYSKNVVLSSPALNSNKIYIGGYLNNSDVQNYTSFSGRINQAVLFNDTITPNDLNICVDCSFATGYALTTGTFSTSGFQITGVNFSGVQQPFVTGQTTVTGFVTRNDGSLINIIVPSGITGLVTTGEVALPLLSLVPLTGYRNVYNFLFDTGTMQSFAKFTVEFDLPLISGDVVEVYSYPRFNPNIGLDVQDTDYPTGTNVQIYGNGLAETSGVDYVVVRNAISGFDNTDTLGYDLIVAPELVFDYSGYWQQSRVLMSGGSGYFPPAPQFYENTGVGLSGKVYLTGLSGICTGNPYYPRFGYDVYMNGQKLVSGLQYDISGSGTSGFVVVLSGANLPLLFTEPLYDVSGFVTGFAEVDDSELAFIPQFLNPTCYQFFPTGTISIFGVITGFSEQVWVNGLRQHIDVDYAKNKVCHFTSGFVDEPGYNFTLYDSHIQGREVWNRPTLPPDVGDADLSFIHFAPTALFLMSYGMGDPTWPDGSFLEVYSSKNGGDFGYVTNIDTTGTSFIFTGDTLDNDCYAIRLRYHSGNAYGNWFTTTTGCAENNFTFLTTDRGSILDGKNAQVLGLSDTDQVIYTLAPSFNSGDMFRFFVTMDGAQAIYGSADLMNSDTSLNTNLIVNQVMSQGDSLTVTPSGNGAGQYVQLTFTNSLVAGPVDVTFTITP